MNKLLFIIAICLSTTTYSCEKCIEELTEMIDIYQYQIDHGALKPSERKRFQWMKKSFERARDICVHNHHKIRYSGDND